MKLTPEHFMVDESVIDRDYTYFRQLAPEPAKILADALEDTCDRLEYEGSFLYDEYPDQTTLDKITDQIAAEFSDLSAVEQKDFIKVLLCNEMFCRRQRYYRKKKMFQ